MLVGVRDVWEGMHERRKWDGGEMGVRGEIGGVKFRDM